LEGTITNKFIINVIGNVEYKENDSELRTSRQRDDQSVDPE